MKNGSVLYDPIENRIWLLQYFGWIEGYMLVTRNKMPIRVGQCPDHFVLIGEA